MRWMSPRRGHTLHPRRAAGGTTEGKPPGVRGPKPRKPPGKEGPGGAVRFSGVAQEPGAAGQAGTAPRHPRPPLQTPAESEPKAKGARRRVPAAPTSRLRGGRRAPPSLRARRFVTSLVSQQARAARAPPTPRPPARLPASPPAASLRSPRFLRSGAGPAQPSRSLRSALRASTCATPAPRVPRPAPQSVAPSRRPRDAVLPEGNGLRALPPGDLVVRRLHHLLRGRGALRARQPLPPLHQVRHGRAEGPGGRAARGEGRARTRRRGLSCRESHI